MTDGLWSLLGTGAIGYLGYRFVKNGKRGQARRFGVLQGGIPAGQFSPQSNGPPPSFQGSFPQLSVLTWPNAGECKC